MSPRRADSFALGICNGHLGEKSWDSGLGGLLFSSSLKDSNLNQFWSYVSTPHPLNRRCLYFFPIFVCKGCYHHYQYNIIVINHYYRHAYYHAIYMDKKKNIFIDIYT